MELISHTVVRMYKNASRARITDLWEEPCIAFAFSCSYLIVGPMSRAPCWRLLTRKPIVQVWMQNCTEVQNQAQNVLHRTSLIAIMAYVSSQGSHSHKWQALISRRNLLVPSIPIPYATGSEACWFGSLSTNDCKKLQEAFQLNCKTQFLLTLALCMVHVLARRARNFGANTQGLRPSHLEDLLFNASRFKRDSQNQENIFGWIMEGAHEANTQNLLGSLRL